MSRTEALRWLKVLNAGHLAVLDQPLLIDYILEALGVGGKINIGEKKPSIRKR